MKTTTTLIEKKSSLITELGNNSNTIQLEFINTTDQIKKVNAFQTFNSNQEGVEVINVFGTSMEFLRKFFYENPHLSSLIRLQSQNLMGIQAEKAICLVYKNPMGQVAQIPAILPLDSYNKNQFQSDILDIQYSFVLDGLSSDLEFDLLPNTTLVMTIFFSHKCIDRTKKSLKELYRLRDEFSKKRNETEYVTSIVVENTSNEPKEIVLLDLDKFDEYSKDENLIISSIFDISYKGICEIFYANKRYFNSIRIFATGENKLKQILKPIQFNSGNTYFPAIEVNGTQFQEGINDINIIGEELSTENPMKVIVMPNTRVVYLFKKIKDLKPTSTNGSFVNIDVENPINESRKVNILSYYGEDKAKKLSHFIGKNKLSLNSDDFKFNFMRIQFNNQEQIENPILIKTTNSQSTKVVTIHPIVYFNENNFISNVLEIPLDESISLKGSAEIIVELNKKGDGMNVILFNKEESEVNNNVLILDYTYSDNKEKLMGVPKPVKVNNKLFPIWLENKNDEPIEIELVNDILDYKEFPDGIKCCIDNDIIDGDSYNDFLTKINKDNYQVLDIAKIYSKNTAQITQTLTIVDYTNPESPNSMPITIHNYFSAIQFQSSLVSLCGGVTIFDLTKESNVENNTIAVGEEIHEFTAGKKGMIKKQKLTFTILPKTKVAFICNLE